MSSIATVARPPKKNATIVAIDVAGYSQRTETDETGAVLTIRALGKRITAAAEQFEGRVFNTAGDGFMLEFANPAQALSAAFALIAEPDPPIRVGIHSGRVSVMPTGDLLGHAVNVAARLQQIASPLGIVVSDDVRRAVRGPEADQLTPCGMVQLNKMEETIGVHALGPISQTAVDARIQRSSGFPVAPVLAVTALVFLGLLAWLGTQLMLNAPRTTADAPPPIETTAPQQTAASLAPASDLRAGDPAEQALWEETVRRNEMSAFRAFLERYPQSVFAPEAAWLSTPDTVAGYTEYLNRFPASPYAAEASARRDARAAQDARADDAAWETALDINRPEAFQQYLENYPNGLHAAEARAKAGER